MLLMLSVTNKPFMLSVIMLSVIMLSVIMLSVIMLSVVMQSVVSPLHTVNQLDPSLTFVGTATSLS